MRPIARLWAVAPLMLTGAASANLRAPHIDEGGFSGAVRTAAPRAPVLRHERMEIGFDTDDHHLARRAVFSITYTVEVTGGPLELPLEFLGIAIEEPEVRINGEDVDFDRRTDRRLQAELIQRLVAQRCGFRPAIGQFDQLRLELLDHLSGRGERVTCEKLDALRAAADRARARQLGIYDKLDTIAFVARLPAGTSRIQVFYRQPLFVSEGPYKSSEFGVRDSALGFDYLLYPARTWTLDPRFRLEIEIALPHPRIPGVFRDSYPAPRWRSNLAFTDKSPKEVPQLFLKGAFDGLPADVFTFVFSPPP